MCLIKEPQHNPICQRGPCQPSTAWSSARGFLLEAQIKMWFLFLRSKGKGQPLVARANWEPRLPAGAKKKWFHIDQSKKWINDSKNKIPHLNALLTNGGSTSLYMLIGKTPERVKLSLGKKIPVGKTLYDATFSDRKVESAMLYTDCNIMAYTDSYVILVCGIVTTGIHMFS